MKMVIYIAGVLVGLAIIVLLVGFLLPKDRIFNSNKIFAVNHQVLEQIILNFEDQPSWRNELQEVRVTNSNITQWTETAKDGKTSIDFQLEQYKPGNTIEMKFSSKLGFYGYWKAKIEVVSENQTRLYVEETVTNPSPIGRLFSYLFFDLEATVNKYLTDLEAKVKTVKKS